jgi:hypothetical protein
VVIIPLLKKSNNEEYGDHRTISLIQYASKTMLKILTKEDCLKANGFMGKNQFRFREECGTREAIGVLRVLCDRVWSMVMMLTPDLWILKKHLTR